MNHIFWLMATMLLRTVQPDERDAVLGDIMERGNADWRALRDVAGLVARRQLLLWRSWEAWTVFLGLVVPFCVILAEASARSADSDAVSIWAYTNNWDWASVGNPDFVHGLESRSADVAISFAALAFRSWSAGFTLALLSHRRFAANALLLCCMLLLTVSFGGNLPLEFRARNYTGNAVVFAVPFYRLFFPPAIVSVLGILPLLRGIRDGAGALPLPRPTLVVTAIIALSLAALQSLSWWRYRPLYSPTDWQVWWLAAQQFYSAWPILLVGSYLAGCVPWRRAFNPGRKASE